MGKKVQGKGRKNKDKYDTHDDKYLKFKTNFYFVNNNSMSIRNVKSKQIVTDEHKEFFMEKKKIRNLKKGKQMKSYQIGTDDC